MMVAPTPTPTPATVNPVTLSAYPVNSSGYPATSSGYPAPSSGYPATSSAYQGEQLPSMLPVTVPGAAEAFNANQSFPTSKFLTSSFLQKSITVERRNPDVRKCQNLDAF